MKISKLSVSKLLWLINSRSFKTHPINTLSRVIRWEKIRLLGRPVSYVYDDDINVLLYPEDGIARLVYYFGYHEPMEFHFLDKFLSKEMICIDIGSNIGMYSLFMAKRAGLVIAFEPQISTWQKLNQSISANGIENIININKAISNKNQKIVLKLVDDDSARAFTVTAEENDEEDLIEAIKLDDYLEQNPIERLDFIKIDTDGSEDQVLKGSELTLKKYRPVIQVEILEEFSIRHEIKHFRFEDFFSSCSYQLFCINPKTNVLIKGKAWNSYAIPQEKINSLSEKGLISL